MRISGSPKSAHRFRFPIKQYIIRHPLSSFLYFTGSGSGMGVSASFSVSSDVPRSPAFPGCGCCASSFVSGFPVTLLSLFRLDRHFLVCQERNILWLPGRFPGRPRPPALYLYRLNRSIMPPCGGFQFSDRRIFQILVPYAHPFTLPVKRNVPFPYLMRVALFFHGYDNLVSGRKTVVLQQVLSSGS